jgi:hypothetical protein
MIALVVYLNGKKLTVAGAEDLGVLSTILSAGGTLGKITVPYGKKRRVSVHLSVGGLTRRPKGQDEHLRWISVKPVRIGDMISVRIIRTTRPSKHQSAVPHDKNMFIVKGHRLRNLQKKRSKLFKISRRG